MGTDYFAHCAFGIVLEGAEHEAFQAQYDLARVRLIAAYQTAQKFEGNDVPDDESEEAWLESLRALDVDEFRLVTEAIPFDTRAAIRQAVGAPDDAVFMSTGEDEDEDDRPGRCAIEVGRIVVGYGPFTVERLLAERFQERTRPRVGYESWVTSG